MWDNACIWSAAALCNVTVVHYSVLLDLHIRPTNTVQFTMTVENAHQTISLHSTLL
jgi:hypothetical protein